MPDSDEDFIRLPRIEPQSDGGPTFHAISQSHLRGKVEREWLVENLLPRRSVAILSGWSSVGKTHVINDLMLSVALGLPFAGMEVKRIGGAVLFAAEGADDVDPRWEVLKHVKIRPYFKEHGLAEGTPYPVHYTEEVPRLTAPDAYDQYSRALVKLQKQQRVLMLHQDRGLGLVAIDTMAAAVDMSGDQHNAAGSNQAVFNVLHRLAKAFDVCVMVVDHLGKDATKGTRGSNAKEASADVVLRVTGNVSDDGTVTQTAMTIAKLRGGASGKRLPFRLKPVKMPRKDLDGVVVLWDTTSDGVTVARQNKRHPMLMRAFDEALLEQFEWVRLGRNMNFKATPSTLIYQKYKLSFAATAEGGIARENTIRKSFNRAMKDSSESQLFATKMLANETVVVWRTDYKHPDSSAVSEEEP